jgi:hypothetical protein
MASRGDSRPQLYQEKTMHEWQKRKDDRRILTLSGDRGYREPVHFIVRKDGSLYIWVDGGEGGDTEGGFYSIEADITLTADETEELRQFLSADKGKSE